MNVSREHAIIANRPLQITLAQLQLLSTSLNSSLVFADSSFILSLREATSGPPVPALNPRLKRLVIPRPEVVDEPYSWSPYVPLSFASSDLWAGFVEACLAGGGNTGRVTQQADRTELYWGRRDEDVVQGQDLNYRTRRRMPVYVRCDLCDDVIRRAALHFGL